MFWGIFYGLGNVFGFAVGAVVALIALAIFLATNSNSNNR
jgi:hypothetical protein